MIGQVGDSHETDPTEFGQLGKFEDGHVGQLGTTWMSRSGNGVKGSGRVRLRKRRTERQSKEERTGEIDVAEARAGAR